MDERKIVKVIDEHDIDRTANIMCSIDIDGSDYVIYSIKRDEDNDNLFVSKLIKNNDGTSNMVNIEDSMEKGRLVDIVKELITFSINSEADKTTGIVNLSSGKEIKVSNVLINKEQNINVGKTYITTVKRSVTKVGNNFYNVEFNNTQPAFESIFENSSLNDNVFPELETINESVSNSQSEVQQIIPEINNVETVANSIISDSTVTVPEEVPMVQSVDSTIPQTPVSNESFVSQSVTSNQNPQVEVPFFGSEAVTSSVSQQENVISEVNVQPIPNYVDPTSTEPVNNDKIVFDGSKETNLNVVLGEVSKDNIVQAADVAPIREFGQDDVSSTTSNNVSIPMETNDKAGFASNKFLMVVAITFFLAACVFLGYEVFNYFKLVG